MSADTFERIITTREYRMRVNDGLLPLHLRDIPVHARYLKGALFGTKYVRAARQIVIAYLHVLEGAYRLELSPVHLILLAEPSECWKKIFAAAKKKKEDGIYQHPAPAARKN